MSKLTEEAEPKSLRPLTLKMALNFVMNAPEIRAAAMTISKAVCAVYTGAVKGFSFLGCNAIKNIWVGSHVFCVTGYFLYLCFKGPLYYRLSIFGALITYSLSVFKDFQVLTLSSYQDGRKAPLVLLLNSENSLLVCSVVIHAVTPPHMLKLVSFVVFSWLNLAWFMVNEIIPNCSFSESLLPLIRYIDPILMSVACYADYSAVTVYFYQFVVGQTLLVYWVIFTYLSLRRIEHSNFSRKTLFSLVSIVHSLSQYPYVPRHVSTLTASMKTLVATMVPMEPEPSHYEEDVYKGYVPVQSKASATAYDGFSVIDDLEL